jgi:hypothetical protein
VRRLPAHLGRRLVLAQTLVNHLAQQIVVGPGEIFHLNDQLGPYPMHAAEDQWGSEAAVARRRHFERHRVDSKRLQPSTQPFQLRLLDASAGAAGIDQPSVRIVIGEQQRAESRPRAFGIGPADDDKFLAVQAFEP